MDEIKDKFIGLIVILFIIFGGLTALFCFFSELFNALLWVIFVDNAETGLPMWAEILVKGIVEVCVVTIAVSVGLSKSNPIVMIISIVSGFGICLACYWIATYIIWIMIGLAISGSSVITFFIIHKKKNKGRL